MMHRHCSRCRTRKALYVLAVDGIFLCPKQGLLEIQILRNDRSREAYIACKCFSVCRGEYNDVLILFYSVYKPVNNPQTMTRVGGLPVYEGLFFYICLKKKKTIRVHTTS
jgi:hypothetical protein